MRGSLLKQSAGGSNPKVLGRRKARNKSKPIKKTKLE